MHYFVHHDTRHHPIVIEICDDGRFSVEQEHERHQWHKTLVIKIKGRTYRVSDTNVPGYDDGEEQDMPHVFALSPDQKWLFVTKHLFSPVDVGYLYHFTGPRFIRLLPDGRRFDEAALRFFAKRIHTPLATIEAGARSIGFEKWTADGRGLVFWFDISKSYTRRPDYQVTGYYGLYTHRFRVVSHVGPFT